MVVIPGPVEFEMGSPTAEVERKRDDELPHKRRIPRTFALAAKAVTKEQFLRFDSTFDHPEMRRFPDPKCPMGAVSWPQAAEYCNWLSKQEGIPPDQWCYEKNVVGTRLKANHLDLTGYRLPTEAEIEFATRAGAATSRFYGETEELLGHYAWYLQNSNERTWPVGGKLPNDLGLFDIYGNVLCWCEDSYKPYPKPRSDGKSDGKDDGIVVDEIAESLVLRIDPNPRILRGGSCYFPASMLRSAYRTYFPPPIRFFVVGVRPARTLTW